MWGLDHKESWAPNNWCFWIVVLNKTPDGPLDCKEMKPVNPKGSQPWIFIGRSDVQVEAPIRWPPDAKSQLIGKDPDAGNNVRRRSGWQRMRWLDDIIDSINMNLGKLWEMVRDREAYLAAVHGVAKSWTWLGNWTTTTTIEHRVQWHTTFTRV